ncbi:MAG: bifunctional aldolase/short-chain dehydrogenase [Verrucomicrobia bacterium]|nr:bifunctional aldolase/short-chain dehydrogenase [Verrucomicrobiota bacterium]
MNSLWNDKEAEAFKDDPKGLRAYTSRLLGQDPNLVLHGGGNTSVKLEEKDFFGENETVLFCKGSGRDLGTIEVAGFAPLRLNALLKLAELETLSDTDMVDQQRVAMLDPNAPNASVEAILHAIIPHRYVDHTHADAIIALTNTENAEDKVREVFGDRILIVPYLMAGFVLARKVYEITKDINWDDYDGMVLMKHGLFTFDDDARSSYENTIDLVSKAEAYLEAKNATQLAKPKGTHEPDLLTLAKVRKSVSEARGVSVLAKWDSRPSLVGYSELEDIADIGTRGPVTPDHSILTKRIPLILDRPIEEAIETFGKNYQAYFDENQASGMTRLDLAPRWIIWPGQGTISLGATYSEAGKISDIAEHTAKVVQHSESLGGWKALSPKNVFDVEYWELEQAKLKKNKATLPLQGKVALVSGAASGIGKACAEQLHAAGAAVVATDLNPAITNIFNSPTLIGKVCDVTDKVALQESVHTAVSTFGGLDIIVSNAGIFPQGQYIDQMDDKPWDSSLALNLTQHKNLLRYGIPFLRHGIDPTIIFIGTKNIPAPGPGASAYSVAKAGLNQLMRVAALELGAEGIRVNIVHPDSVFDTAIWAGGVLEARAEKYGLTVEEYMSRNVMKTPVASLEVANMVASMAGTTFLKTTGAQITVDGGNDRVI